MLPVLKSSYAPRTGGRRVKGQAKGHAGDSHQAEALSLASPSSSSLSA